MQIILSLINEQIHFRGNSTKFTLYCGSLA